VPQRSLDHGRIPSIGFCKYLLFQLGVEFCVSEGNEPLCRREVLDGSVLLSMRGRLRRAIEWGILDVSDVNSRSILAGVLILRSTGFS
jgi:hypothetical protein